MFRERKNISIIILAIAVITLGVICLSPKKRELTDLERITLDKYSENAMDYMEEIDITAKSDEDKLSEKAKLTDIPLDRFIAYALEYSYGENDKDSLTVKEIKQLIRKKFDINLNTEKLNAVGVSPLLLDKHIDHEPVSKKYTINKSRIDKREIADTPIAKYIKSDTVITGTGYTITFDKYVAKSPYDVLPHANNVQANTKDYLEGKGKINEFKKIIDSSNAGKVGKLEKQTSIDIAIKDDKLIIKSIYTTPEKK